MADIEGLLDDLDVYILSHMIMYRQLKHELLGLPFYLEDIEAYLAFSPWIEGNEDGYESAIIKGLIPGMEYDMGDYSREVDNPDFGKAVQFLLDSTLKFRPSMKLRESRAAEKSKV